jgi:hypothetical protein
MSDTLTHLIKTTHLTVKSSAIQGGKPIEGAYQQAIDYAAAHRDEVVYFNIGPHRSVEASFLVDSSLKLTDLKEMIEEKLASQDRGRSQGGRE